MCGPVGVGERSVDAEAAFQPKLARAKPPSTLRLGGELSTRLREATEGGTLTDNGRRLGGVLEGRHRLRCDAGICPVAVAAPDAAEDLGSLCTRRTVGSSEVESVYPTQNCASLLQLDCWNAGRNIMASQ